MALQFLLNAPISPHQGLRGQSRKDETTGAITTAQAVVSETFGKLLSSFRGSNTNRSALVMR